MQRCRHRLLTSLKQLFGRLGWNQLDGFESTRRHISSSNVILCSPVIYLFGESYMSSIACTFQNWPVWEWLTLSKRIFDKSVYVNCLPDFCQAHLVVRGMVRWYFWLHGVKIDKMKSFQRHNYWKSARPNGLDLTNKLRSFLWWEGTLKLSEVVRAAPVTADWIPLH